MCRNTSDSVHLSRVSLPTPIVDVILLDRRLTVVFPVAYARSTAAVVSGGVRALPGVRGVR